VAVPDDAGVRENLIARTPLASNPEAAKLLLETPGPASLSFTVGPDGDAGNVRVSVGASASADFSVRENTSVDSITGETVRGGVGILYEPEYLETKLRDAWAPDQDWGDATKLTALAEGFGRAWTQQGISFSALSAEQLEKQLSGRLGIPIRLGPASVSGAGAINSTWSESASIGSDGNTQLAAHIIEGTREALAREYGDQFGANWASSEERSEAFNRDWATNARAAFTTATQIGQDANRSRIDDLVERVLREDDQR
jgi:hypothetical protein